MKARYAAFAFVLVLMLHHVLANPIMPGAYPPTPLPTAGEMAFEFILVFAVANLFEIPTAYLLLRKSEKKERIIRIVLLLNLITVAFLLFVPWLIMFLAPESRSTNPYEFHSVLSNIKTAWPFIAEFIIFLFEMGIYALAFRNAGWKRAVATAFVANIVSFVSVIVVGQALDSMGVI